MQPRPDFLRRIAPTTWLVLGIIAGLIYLFRGVLGVLVGAFLIAYLFHPLVGRFERLKLSRQTAVSIVLLLGGLVSLAVTLIVVPSLVHQIVEFANALPRKLEGLISRLGPTMQHYGINPPQSIEQAMADWHVEPRAIAERIAGPVGAALSVIAGSTAAAVSSVVGFITLPLFATYILYDFDHILEGLFDLVPFRYRAPVGALVREIDGVLSEYIRGQLMVMAAVGTLYAIGFSIIGVPLAIPISLLAGVLSFIPYVGSGSALVGSLLLLLLEGGPSMGRDLGLAAAWYVVVQVLEGFVIVPRIMEHKLGVSSLWILIALLAGGELFGFVGVLLAVPTVAVLRVLARRVLEMYRASSIYRGDLVG